MPNISISPPSRYDHSAGLESFAFLEFAGSQNDALALKFEKLGFTQTARHRKQSLEIWQQGEIELIINAQASPYARQFSELHGSGVCGIGLYVQNLSKLTQQLRALGAVFLEESWLPFPTVKTPSDIRFYLVEKNNVSQPYRSVFQTRMPAWEPCSRHGQADTGLMRIDHLAINVLAGRSETWLHFLKKYFQFTELEQYGIDGEYSGLNSRIAVSANGKIRLPINEERSSAKKTGQIAEFLDQFGGDGVQHIAFATENIYASCDALDRNGLRFAPPPPPGYYTALDKRLAGHGEDEAQMEKHGILLDGRSDPHSDQKNLLLQIFSRPSLGPIFFEFIQRKGDEGFGAGNIKALFESFEREQIQRQK